MVVWALHILISVCGLCFDTRCIGCFSVAVIKHYDQKPQLKVERVLFGSYSSRGTVHCGQGGTAVGG